LSSIKIIEIGPVQRALLLSGSYFHYAPDAAYLKINPMVQLSIREKSIRINKKAINLFLTSDSKQKDAT
jgi:hypothetical protein